MSVTHAYFILKDKIKQFSHKDVPMCVNWHRSNFETYYKGEGYSYIEGCWVRYTWFYEGLEVKLKTKVIFKLDEIPKAIRALNLINS